MNLGDYKQEGGDWLKVGDHHAMIKAVKVERPQGKNPFVDFTFAHLGAEHRERFYLTEKAMFRVARLATACGLTDEQLTKYDPDNTLHHERMIGKECMIRLDTGSNGYREIVKMWKVGADAPPAPAPKAAPVAQEQPQDDIPF